MKKKSFLLSVALMLTSSVAAQTNRLWTLQQCLDYAMQHNITLQRARLQLQSAKEYTTKMINTNIRGYFDGLHKKIH